MTKKNIVDNSLTKYEYTRVLILRTTGCDSRWRCETKSLCG